LRMGRPAEFLVSHPKPNRSKDEDLSAGIPRVGRPGIRAGHPAICSVAVIGVWIEGRACALHACQSSFDRAARS
jgi:hypothetical protein